MIFASPGWPSLPAREFGLEQNLLGTTTMRWAAWKARSCSAAVGPSNAEGGFFRSCLPHLQNSFLRNWVFLTVEL